MRRWIVPPRSTLGYALRHSRPEFLIAVIFAWTVRHRLFDNRRLAGWELYFGPWVEAWSRMGPEGVNDAAK